MKRFYFTFDLRSLGLFRILFASILIVDWFTRWPHLEAFYTAQGVIPNVAWLLGPTPDVRYSLLAGAETLPVVRFFFVIALVSYITLLLGYKTRFFHFLSWLLYLSIVNRNEVIGSIADSGVIIFGLWALFLPLGERFSVDSLLASKSRKPSDPRPRRSQASLAALVMIVQLGIVYSMTAMAKTGDFWKEGTAVYYTLHLEHYASPFGALVAGAPLLSLKMLNYGLLILEWSSMLLLLLPVFQPYLRWIFMLGLGAFHLGSATAMDIGMISYPFPAVFVLLWNQREWDCLHRMGHRLSRTRPGSVIRDACRRFEALLSTALDQWGLGTRPLAESSPVWQRMRRLSINVVVGLIFVTVLLGSYNDGIVRTYDVPRLPEPPWTRTFLDAFTINTRWNMFAPDPSTVNGWWVIRGITDANQEIDPLTGRAPVWTKPADLHGMYDPYWTRFMFRLSMGEFHNLRLHYARYIVRLNYRDFPVGQRLKRFDFFFIEQRTLPPGSRKPFPFKPVYLWSYDRHTDRITTQGPAP